MLETQSERVRASNRAGAEVRLLPSEKQQEQQKRQQQHERQEQRHGQRNAAPQHKDSAAHPVQSPQSTFFRSLIFFVAPL